MAWTVVFLPERKLLISSQMYVSNFRQFIVFINLSLGSEKLNKVRCEVLILQYFFQFSILSLLMIWELHLQFSLGLQYFTSTFIICLLRLCNSWPCFVAIQQLQTPLTSHHSKDNQQHCHTFKCNALVEPKEGGTDYFR